MTKIFEGAGGGGSKRQTNTEDNLLSDDLIEVVLGVAEGPIKGLVGDTDADKAKSIFIGDTPLADAAGNSNFEDFVMAAYRGTPTDTPIDYALGGATTNHSSSVSLPVTLATDVAITRTWTSPPRDPSTHAIVDIRIQIQQLYRADNNGTFNETVEIQVAYKHSSSATWINWDHDPVVSNFPITGKTTGGYIKEFTIWLPGVATGSYEFRVTKKSPINTTQVFRNVAWESFQTSLPGTAGVPFYDDPNFGGGPFPDAVTNTGHFPDTALLHLKGRATDQFSSVPEFSGLYEGWEMKVPSNYNPELRTYSGTWDGTFYANPTYTNNPALVLYNLIVDERLGLARYYKNVSANRYVFYKAAQWCDTLVPDGNGGYQPRFTLNELITEPRNGLELLQYIAGAFNSTLFDDENGTVHLRTDEYETPLQIFTPENTSGDFQYTYSDIATRVNSITVSFVNPDLNWNEDRRLVEDAALITENSRIPMDFIAIGCTDVHEATRRAAYRLVTANTEVTSVSFVTSRLGMLTSIFQTIYVADPDSGWSQPGRVKSIVGNVVNLRDPIFFTSTTPVTMVIQTAVAATYPITGSKSAYLLTEATVVPPGTGLQSSFTKTAGTFPSGMPAQCVFTLKGSSFGLPKPFKVMQIEELTEGGGSYRITALEVNVNKYSDVESGVTSAPTAYSYQTPQFPLAPTNLQTRAGDGEVRRSTVTGELQYFIFVSWERVNRPYTSHYEVEWWENGQGQHPTVTTVDDYCYLGPLNPGTNYDVRLTAVSPIGTRSKPLTVLGTNVPMRTLPPSNVTGLTAVNTQGLVRIAFDWPIDKDYHNTLINEGATWAGSTPLQNLTRPLGSPVIEHFEDYGLVSVHGNPRKFWVAHVNTTGQISVNPQSVTVAALVPPNVTGLTAVNEDGVVHFTFNVTASDDYQNTQIRKGASWAAGTLIADVTPLETATTAQHFEPYDGTPGVKQFWLAHFNTSGVQSAAPVTVSVTVTVPAALVSISLKSTVREVRFASPAASTPVPGGANIVAQVTLVNTSIFPTFSAAAYNAAGTLLGAIAMPYVSGSVLDRTFTPTQFVTYALTDHVIISATVGSLVESIFISRLNDGAAGADGIDGLGLSISANKGFFRRLAGTNAISPSNDVITLTATKQNTVGTVTWSTSPSVSLHSAPTGGTVVTSGDVVYLRAASFAANTDLAVTASIAADGLTDTLSIASVRDGASAPFVVLGNPVHQLPTTALDVVTYTGSGTTIQVIDNGAACVITGCTAVGTNITATSPVTTGIGTSMVTAVAHSAILATNASVRYTVTYTRPDGTSNIVYETQSLAKNVAGVAGAAGAPGAAGAAAKLLTITTDAFGFRRDANGAIAPSNATVKLTANKQNTSNTVNWVVSPSANLYSAATGGSLVTTGDIVYLRAADMGANTTLAITANIAADSLTDSVGLVTTRDGDLAPVVVLSNPSHPLPTNTAGTVTYTGSGTTIQVLEGGVARTITACTVAATSITAGAVSGLGTSTVTIAAASAIAAATASIKYTLTFTKGDATAGTAIYTQTLFKATQGATGADALASAIVYAYQRKSTVPTLNAGAVTYDFTTKTMTAPVGNVLSNGWYKTIPAGTDDLYVQAATAVATSGAPTVASVLNTDWSAPAVLASDGLNVATVLLYARNDTPGSPPAAITGTVVYTFADGTMTGVAAPWSASIPSASTGSCLWVIRATAAASGATDSLAAAEFSAASLLVSSATTLFLTATGSNFLFDDPSATSSTSPTVTFTAVLQNQPAGSIASFTAQPYNSANTPLVGVTLGGGASNTRTLTAAQFLADPTTAYVVVTATIGSYTDTMTVTRVNGGADALYVELSNSDHSFTALADGTVSLYTGSGTTVVVKEGTTTLTYDPAWAGVTAGFWKLSTTSPTNITVGTLTDAGAYLSVGDHSGVAAGTDASSIIYSITGKTLTGASFTLAPKQTFSKSKAGAAGAAGATAKTVALTLSTAVFRADSVNTIVAGQVVTLTLAKQNTSANILWQTSPSVALYDAPTAGAVVSQVAAVATNPVYMRAADYAANTLVEVTATCDSLVDKGSVARVRDGTLATTVRLSNPNHPVPAPFGSTSMAGALAGSGTTITVYEGSTLRNITGVTIAGTSVTTPGTLASISGGVATINAHTGLTATSGKVEYTITFTRGDGTSGTVYETQYLQLQIAGDVGADGGAGSTGSRSTIISLYAWAFSDPGAPASNSTYTWANAVPHVYAGSAIWTVGLPTDTIAGKKLYYTEQTITDPTGVAASTSGISWASTPRTVLTVNPLVTSQCFARFTGSGAVPSGLVVTPLGRMPVSTDFSTTWLANFVATQPSLSTGETLWLCDGYPNTLNNPTTGGSFIAGDTYTIISLGTTDFTTIGATSNTVGLSFVATGVGSGTGSAYRTAISVTAGSFVTGVSYTITSLGTTNFTLIGAASNTVGLTFQATGAGTGTGKATTAAIAWSTPYLATFKVGSLSALQANLGTVTIGTDGAVRTNGINFGGVGVYLGYSAAGTYYGTAYGAAAYRFSVGDGTNYLAWDGTALKINGTPAATVVAGAAAGATAMQAADIANKLEAGSSYTLTGVVTPADTGAFKVGTITWNPATGALTGGTGIAITENGLLGALGGVAKFSLLADGTATFAGTLSAAVGTFGAVTVAPTGSISSGQTAYATGTGFWLEANSGTPRFSIGSATAYLRWTGSALNLGGGVVDGTTTLNGTATSTVVSQAAAALPSANFNTTLATQLASGTNNFKAANSAGSYTVDIGTTSISFRDNNAVLAGAGPATAGNKLALGINASGILGGYNLATTGVWRTTFLMDTPTGNMTVGYGSSALLYTASTGVMTLGTGVTIAADGTATFSGALSAATGSFGTVTVTTSGSISNGISYGGTGFFLGYSGAAYKFSLGNATDYLKWDGATLTIAGGAIGGTTTISGTVATTVVAGAAAGATAVQPAALTAKLEAGSSYTLTGVVTPADTGAFKVGTITWNATTGALTGGTGIAITENGLLGALGGVAKFSLLADGTATFAGALSAATGSFGAVTADSSLTLGAAGYISNGIAFGGTGLFMGYSAAGTYYGTVYGAAAYRFSIGNSTSHLSWDGTNLAMAEGVFDIGTSGVIRAGQTAYGTGIGFWMGKSGSYHVMSFTSPGLNISALDTTTYVFTTSPAHNLANGTPLVFQNVNNVTGIVANTTYYMRDVTSTTFKLASTVGGAVIVLGNTGSFFPPTIKGGTLDWNGVQLIATNANFTGGSVRTASTGVRIELTDSVDSGDILWMTDGALDYFSLCQKNTTSLMEVITYNALSLSAATLANNDTGKGVRLATSTEDIELLTGAIKFPATKVANTNVNTLDDYEEGTWTPNLSMTSGSCTLTTAVGSYTKIGNRVQLEATLVVNTVSAPLGALSLGNLPFTSSSTPTGMKFPATIWAEGLGATNSAGTLMAHLPVSSTTINISRLASGVRTNDVGAAIQASSVISISISYSTES